LAFDRQAYAQVTSIDREAWDAELGAHGELFAQLAERLPKELAATRGRLAARIAAKT
jgi:phosphoenolpyruvate carboxykinase (GTP)